jgi:hypothetical protein
MRNWYSQQCKNICGTNRLSERKVKGKAVSVLNSLYTKPRRRIREWGIGLSFFTSTPDGSDWSVSLPCSGKRAPGTRWVGPTAGLDAMEKRRIAFPVRNRNPGRPARSPYTVRWLKNLTPYEKSHNGILFFRCPSWQSALVKTCFNRGKERIASNLASLSVSKDGLACPFHE